MDLWVSSSFQIGMTDKELANMEVILRRQCGFDYDGYVNSFNCYSGAKALYDAGYRLVLIDHCIRCNRPLIVPQHLDYVNTPKGKMCVICKGGS